MSGRTPEELEAEIATQREELAVTVDRLGAKLDVPARARTKVGDLKDRATTDSGKPRPEVLVAAGSLIAIVAVVVVWRLRQGGN